MHYESYFFSPIALDKTIYKVPCIILLSEAIDLRFLIIVTNKTPIFQSRNLIFPAPYESIIT